MAEVVAERVVEVSTDHETMALLEDDVEGVSPDSRSGKDDLPTRKGAH